MNFGLYAFAEDAFAAQGGVSSASVSVQVTGNQVNIAVGDVTIVAKANVAVTGNQSNVQVEQSPLHRMRLFKLQEIKLM